MITPELARKGLEALDALQNKELCAGSFYRQGTYCLTGALVIKKYPSIDTTGGMGGTPWIDYLKHDLGIDSETRSTLYHLNDGVDGERLDETRKARYTRVYSTLQEIINESK